MKKVMGDKELKKVLESVTGQFADDYSDDLKKERVGLVGIHTRGVALAKRIADLLRKKNKISVPVGSLDITLYRDDVGEIGNQPLVKETDIPFSIEGKSILLVDDVLFTGRTIRAALDALLELGRPKTIRLLVMVDRGGHELPIQSDYTGTRMVVRAHEEVWMKLKEIDGTEGVWVLEKKKK